METFNTLDPSPFKNMVMTVGNLPTSFVASMSYYEALAWLCNYLETEVIPTVNNNSEVSKELQTKFVELKNYVEHYFDNLDLQDEVNNKLDEMALDGTLAEIINEELFTDLQNQINENKKYKSQIFMICDKGNYGDCYVVKFANGKNMFIDTGTTAGWDHIYLTITSLGITKFDYGVITHAHSDHAGNLENFIEHFDVSDCEWYVGATPDFDEMPLEREKYEAMYAIFTENNITPTVPENNSTITVDTLSKASIRFLNTDPDWLAGYYDVMAEYYTDHQTANVFSLITEITFDNVKFLSLGDAEKCVEDNLVDYVSKTEIATAPHHFTNKHGNDQFWNNLDPETILLNTPTGSLAYGNYEYQKAILDKRNIISNWQADFDYVAATTYGYNFSFDVSNFKGMQYPTLYNDIASLITSEHYVNGYGSISLSIILDSMKNGDTLKTVLKDNYTTLASDLQTLFGIDSIRSGSSIEIVKNYTDNYLITIHEYAKNLSFECHVQGANKYVKGSGVAGSWTNETDLLSIINHLPVGVYALLFNGNEDHALGALECYQELVINKIQSNGYRKGYIVSVRSNAGFNMKVGNFTGASGGFNWKTITVS